MLRGRGVRPAVVFTLGQAPRYDGARSYGKLFTPQSFEDTIATPKEREKAKSSGDKDFGKDRSRHCLVFFGAPWSSECTALAPAFADLSQQYGSDNLRFGEVDIAAWPQLAENHKVRALPPAQHGRAWPVYLAAMSLIDLLAAVC